MSAAWVGYALVIGILLALAAAAVEPVTRLARFPTRYVWLLAMVATVVLTVLAPIRRVVLEGEMGVSPTEAAVSVAFGEPAGAEPAAELALPASTGEVPALSDRIGGALAAIPDPGPHALRLFGAAWLSASLALIALALVIRRRYRGVLHRAPARSVHGTPVRMTSATGPAVLGIVRPEIAVPAWLLAAPSEVQQIVLLHEREHVRSGDPLILGTGGLLVILMPWLLPLWWMYRRLRLAVEVDCDTRVLRTGVSLRAYGSALIEAAAHSPRFAIGVPITIGPRSSLERRLLTMNRKPTRRRIALAAPLLALGLMAVLVACETKLPTAADIQAMDVGGLEERLEQAGISGLDQDGIRYFITEAFGGFDEAIAERFEDARTADAREVTAEQARAIPPESIASIRVEQDADLGGVSAVHITLREDGAAPLPQDGCVPGSLCVRNMGTPLFVIDGIPSDAAAFNRLNASDIESISILKDASAAVYGFRAANGVVLVITKSGAGRVSSERASPAPPPASIHNSIEVAGTPLYVIDGVPADEAAFRRLNASDIESISLLKEASAAVYGFRSHDGVLLVTTRSGAGRVRSDNSGPTAPAPSVQIPPIESAPSPAPASGNTVTGQTVYWTAPPAPPTEEGAAAETGYLFSYGVPMPSGGDPNVRVTPFTPVGDGASGSPQPAPAGYDRYVRAANGISGPVAPVEGVGSSTPAPSPREAAGQ